MACENSARKRSKTMAFRCTPEDRKLICDMATSYGELSESLQQRIKLVMEFFLALSEPVGAPAIETSQQATPSKEPTASAMDAGSDTASIFGMGRG